VSAQIKIPVLDLKPAYEELRAELDAAYHRVMESGRVLFGAELEAFEDEYAKSIGVAHCVGVANGLEALQMILMARGIGPGDEVIVPSHGYIATWLAVTHVGAKPVPCEPSLSSYNLDATLIEALITPKTKAILPINLYGLPADYGFINPLAKRRGLFVLEDAAQSHGARRLDRAAGALRDAAGVSFYPSKNLGALADAGAVTTNDAGLAEKIRHLRNYGSKVRYQNEVIGLNSRLSELQAAFLCVKLPRLAEWNRRRATLAKIYREKLSGIADLELPGTTPGCEHAWHLYVIRTPRRDAFQAHLSAAGIGTQIHYPTPPHLSNAYRSAGWKRGEFPLAEKFAGEVLSLPISPHHTAGQIEIVCASVREFFARA